MGGGPWPLVGKQPTKITEHALQIKDDAKQLLQHNSNNDKKSVSWSIIKPFIESCLDYSDKSLQQPSLHETLGEILAIKADTAAIKNTVTIIKNTVNSPETLRGSSSATTGYRNTKLWAQVAAAKALAPDNIPTSKPSSHLTPSTDTPAKQREVLVKLKDADRISYLRSKSPQYLRDTVNNALDALRKNRNHNSANHNIGARPTVIAAKQLKSGDVRLTMATAADADALRHEKDWERDLSEKAQVVQVTFGVVMHGVPQGTMKMNRQEEVRKNIVTGNASHIPGLAVEYVGFLRKDGEDKKATSVVIEFRDPHHANLAIYKGMLWEGLSLSCERYDRACRICQCFKCWGYGHISESCTQERDHCGKCAAPGHKHRECPSPDRKCSVCKGPHESWNRKCPARQKEFSRIQDAKLLSSRYWPASGSVSPSLTPSSQVSISPAPTSPAGHLPTPAESASVPPSRTSPPSGPADGGMVQGPRDDGFMQVTHQKFRANKQKPKGADLPNPNFTEVRKRKATFSPKKDERRTAPPVNRPPLMDATTTYHKQMNEEANRPKKSLTKTRQGGEDTASKENDPPAAADFNPDITLDLEEPNEAPEADRSTTEETSSVGSTSIDKLLAEGRAAAKAKDLIDGETPSRQSSRKKTPAPKSLH